MHAYQVDGEVGRFTLTTHRVERDGPPPYHTATDVFARLKGDEW